MRSRAFDPIRNKPLVETTPDDFLSICHARGNSIGHYYLRRFHNLALNLGGLAWPVLHKATWPKIRSASKRAVTAEEHAAIIASERNAERRGYYQFLYVTASPSGKQPHESASSG